LTSTNENESARYQPLVYSRRVRRSHAVDRISGGFLSVLDVQAALAQTQAQHPFLFYGTDWLAFGHFVIAIAFIGALRDPVRHRWLFDFGLIACVLVIPYALVFGGLRGISGQVVSGKHRTFNIERRISAFRDGAWLAVRYRMSGIRCFPISIICVHPCPSVVKFFPWRLQT
jgi:hypothetical protein